MFSILLSRVDRVIPRSSSGCCADICGAKRHDFEAGAWRNCMAKFMTVFFGTGHNSFAGPNHKVLGACCHATGVETPML